MLNLKKGLALVLAAATAFTFAPVANLGNAVQAEAAGSQSKTFNATGSDTTVVFDDVDFTDGVWTISTDSDGDANSLNGLTNLTVGKTDGKVLNVALTGSIKKNTELDRFGIGSHTSKDERIVTLTVDTQKITSKNPVKFTFTKITTIKDGTSMWDSDPSVTTISGNPTWTDDPKGVNYETIVLTVNFKNVDGPYFDLSKDSSLSVLDSTLDKYGNKQYEIIMQGSGVDFNFAPALYTKKTSGSAIANTTTAPADPDNVRFEYSDEENLLTYSNATGLKRTDYGQVKITGKTAGTTKLHVKAIAQTDNVAGLGNKKGDVIAEGVYQIQVDSNARNITAFDWQWTDGKVHYITGYEPDGYKDDEKQESNDVTLDTLVTKSLQLHVVAAGQLTYWSSDPSVATVDSTGKITAVKSGITEVSAHASATTQFDALTKSVTIYVSDQSQDVISVKYNGNTVDATHQVDLDPSTSTASTAVKTAKLDAVSAAGLPIAYQIVNNNNSTTPGDSTVATVASDGTISAGTKADTVYVRLTTLANGKIKGAEKYVKVVVNAKPAADFSVSDVKLDLKDNKSKKIDVTTSLQNVTFAYLLDSDAKNIANLTGDIITAVKAGEGKLTVSLGSTANTRYTEKTVKVTVVNDLTKAVSDLKVASENVTVKVGDTASAGASTTASGAAITYSSSDSSVASVASDGTITAVAPGTAVVTVKSSETETMNAGTATIVVTVPSNPQKVTGVKVSNKKGANVTVTWTSQGGNINYRVYKKVGNGKWIAKNVAGNKTSLKVKKGAKVQVKVKSYAKDASGATTWGPAATKAKTFKTDKK